VSSGVRLEGWEMWQASCVTCGWKGEKLLGSGARHLASTQGQAHKCPTLKGAQAAALEVECPLPGCRATDGQWCRNTRLKTKPGSRQAEPHKRRLEARRTAEPIKCKFCGVPVLRSPKSRVQYCKDCR
jgi:hypothetical protein